MDFYEITEDILSSEYKTIRVLDGSYMIELPSTRGYTSYSIRTDSVRTESHYTYSKFPTSIMYILQDIYSLRKFNKYWRSVLG